VTLVTPPFRKNFSGLMSGLSLGACTPNLKFVSLVTLELLAFNPPKFKGSRDPGHAPFSKNFSGVMSGLSLGACMPNLKFVSLTILELLAFNAQKFKGSRDPGHAPFSKKFFRGHVGTFPGSKRAKLEVRTFSHFGAISI